MGRFIRTTLFITSGSRNTAHALVTLEYRGNDGGPQRLHTLTLKGRDYRGALYHVPVDVPDQLTFPAAQQFPALREKRLRQVVKRLNMTLRRVSGASPNGKVALVIWPRAQQPSFLIKFPQSVGRGGQLGEPVIRSIFA